VAGFPQRRACPGYSQAGPALDRIARREGSPRCRGQSRAFHQTV